MNQKTITFLIGVFLFSLNVETGFSQNWRQQDSIALWYFFAFHEGQEWNYDQKIIYQDSSQIIEVPNSGSEWMVPRGKPMNEWHGVELDSNGRVVTLALPNCNLIGSLEYFNNFTLGNLTELKNLYLFDNQLEGELPHGLNDLQNLEKIYLHNNNFSGCFPDDMDICHIGHGNNPSEPGFNFTGNGLLPWAGDFQKTCEGLSPFQSTCDDGNPFSTNDLFFENCECIGSFTSEADSFHLVEFYHETSGPEWTFNAKNYYNGYDSIPIPNAGNKWDFSKPFATWHGIDLDIQGNIKSIILNRNNLNGTLPKLKFSNLEILDLSENDIGGKFDTKIINLVKLKLLSISGARFSLSYTAHFYFPELEYLNIYQRSNFLRSGDDIILATPNLRVLNLAIPNPFSFDFEEINEFDNLERIQVSGELISIGIDELNLSNFPNLTHLSISGTRKDCEFPDLSHNEKLKHVNLSDNSLEGDLPDLSFLSELEYLDISSNFRLKNEFPNIDKLVSLKHLACSSNGFDGNMPPIDHPTLEYLDCSSNRFSGKIPPINAPNLKHLDPVSYTHLTLPTICSV